MKKEKLSIGRMILISTFLWGIFAHGMALFNKYSFHDDSGLFGIGGTYYLGRWMLGILGEGSKLLFGSGYYSTPLFNGILSIVFIAGCTILLVDLFEIKSKWLIIGLSGIMVVFPAVTSTLGFMFTAPYYFLGTLMGVFGGWLSCKYEKWYLYIASLFLMACSVGVYQANIPVCVCLILFYALKKTSEKRGAQWKKFFRLAFKSVFSCVGFMIIYLFLNKFILYVVKMELSDYQGINNMGVTSIRGYLGRIVVAYKEFFSPTDTTSGNMYPFSTDIVYKLLLILAGVATIYLLYCCMKRGSFLCIQVLLLSIFIPLAVNFIYFMCEASQVDSIMTYGEVMIFVYIAWVMDSIFSCDINGQNLERRTKHWMTEISIFLFMILNVMFCRFDNICYLKAEFMQAQAISYFTTLVAQIKSTDGFTENTPVVYINEYGKYDYTTASIPEFKEIELIPYSHSSILNNYAWKITMKMWCDFDPVRGETSDYEDLTEVMEMPTYPDSGSIKMIDGVLVVKF